MTFKVRIFLDGQRIEPEDYGHIVIASNAIDRIVNEIYEKSREKEMAARLQIKKGPRITECDRCL